MRQPKPNTSATSRLTSPEKAAIVRAAVVERLVASRVDRRQAVRLAEESYRRVEEMVEVELRRTGEI